MLERAGGAGAERAAVRRSRPGSRCTTARLRRSRSRSTPARASSRTPISHAALVSLPARPQAPARAQSPRCSTGSSRAPMCSRACYDALVGDRLALDRLRGFADPMQPTNMANELDGETVEAMMTATEENYEIGRRWFAGEGRAARPRPARARRPVRAARRGARVLRLARGRGGRRHRRSAASRRGSPEIFRACLDAGHVDAPPRAGKARRRLLHRRSRSASSRTSS